LMHALHTPADLCDMTVEQVLGQCCVAE
jgi:hypothetical protein